MDITSVTSLAAPLVWQRCYPSYLGIGSLIQLFLMFPT